MVMPFHVVKSFSSEDCSGLEVVDAVDADAGALGEAAFGALAASAAVAEAGMKNGVVGVEAADELDEDGVEEADAVEEPVGGTVTVTRYCPVPEVCPGCCCTVISIWDPVPDCPKAC